MGPEIITGFIGLISGASAGFGAEFLRTQNEERKRRAEAAKQQTQTSSENHKADLESDATAQERLLKRVDQLEAKQETYAEHARKQDERITNLLVMLERVGNQYEYQRKLTMRVASLLRDGKTVDEQTLLEMESIPAFRAVLSGPNAPDALPLQSL